MPTSWKTIAERARERAKWKCQLCNAEEGLPHWKTKTKVVLAVIPLDANRENVRKYNLLVCCQCCRLRLDISFRVAKGMRTREIKKMGGYQLNAFDGK
jgi:hypothetical protein